jgi:hypothetical protein
MIVQSLLSNGFKLPPSTPSMPAFLAAAVYESLKPSLQERNEFEAVKSALFSEPVVKATPRPLGLSSIARRRTKNALPGSSSPEHPKQKTKHLND